MDGIIYVSIDMAFGFYGYFFGQMWLFFYLNAIIIIIIF